MAMDFSATDGMEHNSITYPRRLFLWLLCYSLLLVGCFVGFQYHREKEFKAGELNSQLQLVNNYILNELDRGVEAEHIDMSELHQFGELRVTVIDSDGIPEYDNSPATPSGNHLDREEIRKAMTTGRGYTVRRHSESTGDTYFYSATKGDSGFIVRTAVPYSISLSELLRADYGFLWFMGAVTTVMCVIGYFATRRLGQNIRRLSQFAESVEKGERISDTEPFPHDELGEISNHIVRLYARLQQAQTDRDREHRTAMHEQREKERIKKQLTNNINHELKTPVASIQVCVETLLAHPDLPEEKRRGFLDRCLSGTVRLKRMLADVSLITRMDDGGSAIAKEPINLAGIIHEALAESRPLAEARGIDVVCHGIDGNLTVNGNRGLLHSIFSNLIDNAIAYSGCSAITIERMPAPDGRITLVVGDNGCGVDDEHLPRIFERFYRIDKGRSRAAGGTGLGLSIVKNAVAIHGGTISVANRTGGGLAFTITMPVVRSTPIHNSL